MLPHHRRALLHALIVSILPALHSPSCIFFGEACGSEPVGSVSPVHARQDTSSGRIDEVVRSPVNQTNQRLTALLAGQPSTSKLLEFLVEIHDRGQLMALGNSGFPWTLASGWRWENQDPHGRRTILAVEGPLFVAIHCDRKISMTILDRSEGAAIHRGYAGSRRYFGHDGSNRRTIVASSFKHFSRKAPEMFRYLFYFAGPLPTLFDSDVLPRSPVDLISR